MVPPFVTLTLLAALGVRIIELDEKIAYELAIQWVEAFPAENNVNYTLFEVFILTSLFLEMEGPMSTARAQEWAETIVYEEYLHLLVA